MKPRKTSKCPDCGVKTGKRHIWGCDVARCMQTGLQKLTCNEPHDCGNETWKGYWPGTKECAAWNWYATLEPEGWKPATSDTPGAIEDLNRLTKEAKWNPTIAQWEKK